jgi:hypothetical protein
MKTPNLEGFLDLIYQAPNNWENRMRKKIYMYLIWSENSHWRTQQIAVMKRGDVFRLGTKDIDSVIMQNNLALAYPSVSPLPEKYPPCLQKKLGFQKYLPGGTRQGFIIHSHR